MAAKRYKEYNANWPAWIAPHTWWDKTKAVVANLPHRAILHHDAGVALFCAIHGETINGVPSAQIARDHLVEDLGEPKTLDVWADLLQRPQGFRIPRPLQLMHDDPLAGLIARHGGTAKDYEALLILWNMPGRISKHPSAPLIIENAFGIFLIEEALGPALSINKKLISTRTLGEELVIARHGYIPSLTEILHFRISPWMHGTTKR